MQKTVNIGVAVATAGDRASQNVKIYTPKNYLAGEGGVKVGGFVWADDDNPDTIVVATGSGTPLGFVERVLDNPNFDVSKSASMDIKQGGNVTVAIRGDFYTVADKAVAIGDTVYAKTASGAVTFASTNAVDTGFKAVSTAANGEMVIISKV